MSKRNDFANKPKPRRAETEARTGALGESTPALPVTKKCATCKLPKAIHFYAPSEWKLNYGKCRKCAKEYNVQFNQRSGRATRCVPFTSVPIGERA